MLVGPDNRQPVKRYRGGKGKPIESALGVAGVDKYAKHQKSAEIGRKRGDRGKAVQLRNLKYPKCVVLLCSPANVPA